MLEIQSKNLKNLSKIEDIYQLKVGEICVEMVYSENNKSLKECISDILKQKLKIS